MTNGGRVGAHFRNIERRLGLPDEFLTLLTEHGDDWTFVVRLHALVEAAIAQLIRAERHDPRAAAWIEDLSPQGQASLADLALALGVLKRSEQTMFAALSWLRSIFARDIGMTGASLPAFFRAQPPEQLRSWSAQLCAPLIAADSARPDDFLDFLTEAPRGVLWMVAFVVIDRAYDLGLSAWAGTGEYEAVSLPDGVEVLAAEPGARRRLDAELS